MIVLAELIRGAKSDREVAAGPFTSSTVISPRSRTDPAARCSRWTPTSVRSPRSYRSGSA